jgi:hypothetical protein
MNLRQALEKLVEENAPYLLKDRTRDWEAADLLGCLTHGALLRPVHMLSGVYIAAVSEKGLMGEVLFRFKPRG